MTIVSWSRRIHPWCERTWANERFDTVAHTESLNRYYDGMWVFYNCFQPVMRLSGKNVVPTTNGIHRVKRRFDDAKSPLNRLLATEHLRAQTIWQN